MIQILYKDRHIAVCAKPVGVISEDGGIPNLLREQLGCDAYCVHRLDTAVGGVMVYALTKKAAGQLGAYIAADMLDKQYLAVVEGIPQETQGVWEDLLLKDGAKKKSYVVKRMRKGVKEAKLEYKVLSSVATVDGTRSLVWVRLHTGRFHQIRVQFASRKHPLLGDGKYGSKCNRCTTALWACRLGFPHPANGEYRTYDLCPPNTFPWNLFDHGEQENL